MVALGLLVVLVLVVMIVSVVMIVYSLKNEVDVSEEFEAEEAARVARATAKMATESPAEDDLKSFRPKLGIYQRRLAALSESSLPTLVGNTLTRVQTNDLLLNEFIRKQEYDKAWRDDLFVQLMYDNEKEICQSLETAIALIEVAAAESMSMQDFISTNGSTISTLLTTVDEGNKKFSRNEQ